MGLRARPYAGASAVLPPRRGARRSVTEPLAPSRTVTAKSFDHARHARSARGMTAAARAPSILERMEGVTMKLLKPLCAGALTVGVVSVIGVISQAQSQPPQARSQPTQVPKRQPGGLAGAMTDAQAEQLATDAYLYAYPLVTMDVTRRVMTNVEKPEPTKAPMNQFANLKKYPTPDFKEVTAPNHDTLYSAAWLDLSKEPMVLELPSVGNRFYMMPMLDGWTNVFANPGTRTTGTKAQKYLITGPSFTGAIPAGLTELKSPTAMAWIIGRTYSTGTPADIKQVNALQDRYKLTPLSAYGKTAKYTPPAGQVDSSIDMKTPPREQVNAMSGTEYFTLFAKLLGDNPPAPADGPMVEKLAKLGIVPGQPFDPSKADPKLVAAINRAPKNGVAMIEKKIDTVPTENGWAITKTGKYGTYYAFRAAIAFAGLGANLPEDAIYPTAMTDAQGKPLDGSRTNYTIMFKSAKDLPPVRGFWSITLYDPKFFFVPNPMNRYTISGRDKLKPNADGSIPIYIGATSPGPAKQSNWLPAPAGPFVLMLRMYWPSESPPTILDGSWKPPGVEPAPAPQAKAGPTMR
jgi:hypothetical protein